MADFIQSTNKGFLSIWGPTGVGKSALLARVSQLLSYEPTMRMQIETNVIWPTSRVHILEYFLRRGDSDTATSLFDSFCQRLDYKFKIKMEVGTTDQQRKELFTKRLDHVSAKMKEDEKLLLIIDGLDEAKEGDPLLGLLPKELPNNVFIIYGSRPQPAIKYSFYESLNRDYKQQLDLIGLTIADIRSIMMKYVNKYLLSQDYIQAVLNKSDGNPLYLNFLCRGLERKEYALNDATILPNGMKELYVNALHRIENEHPGVINYLNLLAATHDSISAAMAA